jgi:hypothetical protein
MSAGLPNADAALLEIGKLRDYCLSADHPRGKHKARMFRAALGIGREHAEELRSALLAAARTEPAIALHTDRWGQYWRLDAPIARQKRRALVRCVWIVRASEDLPRFVTCWVL